MSRSVSFIQSWKN